MDGSATPKRPLTAKSTSSVRSIAGGLIIAGAVAVFVVGLFLLRVRYETGYAAFDGEKTEEVRAAMELILASYDALISFITAAFGVVAFLVTYQQKQKATVTGRAWALLAVGVVCLVAALILSLLGREYLILMLSRNAVEFGIPMLNYGRWVSYGSVVLAAILVTFFAVEVAASSPPLNERTE